MNRPATRPGPPGTAGWSRPARRRSSPTPMPMNTDRQHGPVLPPTLAAAAALGFLLVAGCRPAAAPSAAPPPPPPWFSDVTAEVGLDFVHDAGPTGEFRLWQTVGSGAAVFDFDGDGRL